MITRNIKETTKGEANSQRHKGGRPTLPKARRRSKSVTIRFSKIDYETLRVRCRKANRRLSEYIRESALRSEVVMTHTTENASLYRELAGMANRSNSVRLQGKNLNQLTKMAHQDGIIYLYSPLDSLLREITNTIREYKQGTNKKNK